jgi:outer membrane immunogenic protein
MKRALGGLAVVAALIGTPAFAADMPLKAPPPPPAWSWTGCYVGLHAGGASGHDQITDVGLGGFSFAAAGTAGQTFTENTTDLMFGGHAGCNYQVSLVVFGIEGDLGMMDLHGSALDPGTASNTQVGLSSGAYGDITGRLGVAFGDFLLYGKAGWAFFNGREAFTTTAPFSVGSPLDTFTGWTAGAGVEYHFSGPWTAKVEYLHYSFGSQNFLLTPAGWPFQEKLTVDTLKVGFSLKFNDVAPVMAKY